MADTEIDLLGAAEAFVAKEDWAAALKALSLPSRQAVDAGALCALARKFGRVSKHDIAEKCCLKARELDPHNARVMFSLADSQFAVGKIDAALSSYESALRLFDAAPASLYHAYSRALVRHGDSLRSLWMYKEALDLEPDNWFFAYSLGSLCDKLEKYEEAQYYFTDALRLKSDNPQIHLSLAHVHEKQGNHEAAFVVLNTAKGLFPENTSVRGSLIGLQLKMGNIAAAVASLLEWPPESELPLSHVEQCANTCLTFNDYPNAFSVFEEALKRSPGNSRLWRSFAGCVFCGGDWKKAHDVYSQAVAVDMYQPAKFYEEFGHVCQQLGILQRYTQWPELVPGSILQEGKRLGDIWRLLNEVAPCDRGEYADLEPSVAKVADLYFVKSANLEVVNAAKLCDDSRRLLAENGIVESYVLSNRDYQITEAGIGESLLPHPLSIEGREQISEAQPRADSHFFWKEQALLDGMMRAVCPFSGELLYSDRSFLTAEAVFYRFESQEVFYLACGLRGLDKSYFYFPKSNIVIDLYLGDYFRLDTFEIPRLQALLVSYPKQVLQYLGTKHTTKTSAVIGPADTPAYHLWNELSALHFLEERRLLERIDYLMVQTCEYFGPIEEVFSDRAPKHIERIRYPHCSLRALEDNCFVVPLYHVFMPGGLIRRIVEISHKKCSPRMTAEAEAARKHFPLLFVNVRVHNRLWLDGVEGLASLLNALYKDFPRLAVIVDGHSSFVNPAGTLITTLAADSEKEYFESIRSLLNPGLTIYNKIGVLMDETILWAMAADCYLVHWGTAAVKPQVLARKPGVSYGAACFFVKNFTVRNWAWVFCEQGIEGPTVLGEDPIHSPAKAQHLNYHLDWKVLYEELSSIIREIPER